MTSSRNHYIVSVLSGICRLPVHHWLAFALYGLGVMQALWLHGSPGLTAALLVCLVPAALIAWLPERRFGSDDRRLAQNLLAIGGFVWAAVRLGGRIPPDVAVIECVALIGISFAFTVADGDYGYLALLSGVLHAYGAFVPARLSYLVLMPLSAVAALGYLYASQAGALVHGTVPQPLVPVAPRRAWGRRAVHMLCIGGLTLVLFAVLPVTPVQSPGMMPTAIVPTHAQPANRTVASWFDRLPQRRDGNGDTVVDGPRPDQTDPRARTRVSGNGSHAMAGGGGGAPGRDLVMQVRSPLKLYWVARIYQRYDGRGWHVGAPEPPAASTAGRREGRERRRQSPSAPRPGSTHKTLPAHCKAVEQVVTIHKWVSPRLFGAWEPISAWPPAFDRRIRCDAAGMRFGDDGGLPEPPFTYLVRSAIPDPEKRLEPAAPEASAAAPDHWLQLPDAVPDRVRKLARRIAADRTSPLQQALAIRDYLRSRYGYSLDAPPVPADRETVDFFLFDLERGHCEYFAAAFTVLARCNGIPARVATGFSPGNFNTLTNTFDVYEYHAHAWTQIRLADHGWITLDATPASAVPSRTGPGAIGALRDPFSKEWRVQPPELTEEARAWRPTGTVEAFDLDDAVPPVYRILISIPMSIDEVRTLLQRLVGGEARPGKPSPGKRRLADTVMGSWRNFLAMLWRIVALTQWLVAAARVSHLLLALTLACGAVIVVIYLPSWRRSYHVWLQIRSSQRRLAIARGLAERDPAECVAECYRLTRDLLELCGWRRPVGLDLFDYGAKLKHVDRDLCRHVLGVFYLYSRLQYSRRARVSLRETGDALERTRKAREFMLRHLMEAG